MLNFDAYVVVYISINLMSATPTLPSAIGAWKTR